MCRRRLIFAACSCSQLETRYEILFKAQLHFITYTRCQGWGFQSPLCIPADNYNGGEAFTQLLNVARRLKLEDGPYFMNRG